MSGLLKISSSLSVVPIVMPVFRVSAEELLIKLPISGDGRGLRAALSPMLASRMLHTKMGAYLRPQCGCRPPVLLPGATLRRSMIGRLSSTHSA